MVRYKDHNQEQGRLLAISLDDQLLPDTFEYTLNYLIDKEIDLSPLDERYKNDLTGAPAYNPRVLLKIILYAYSRGILSSRNIMELCETNIIAKALSADSVPHFTVIADFITSMKEQVAKIFLEILMVCQEMELIGGNLFAIDGVKLPSNASKESSGTFSVLKRRKEKMQRTVKLLLKKHQEMDTKEHQDGNGGSTKRLKSIKRIKDKVRRINQFLNTESPKQGNRGKEVQSNITDNESAKIKTSHGVIQGYNGIAMADEKHQVIVASEAFGKGQEHGCFTPLIEQAEENLKELTEGKASLTGKTVLADTNYFCEENLRTAAEAGIEAIIPDSNFRKRDERFAERKVHTGVEYKFGLHEFTFEAKRNTYICPNGKEMRAIGHTVLNGSSGNRYQSKASDCRECRHTGRCFLRKKNNSGRRTLFVPDKGKGASYSARMIEKIDRAEIRDLYSRRMGIIEPVFANITFHKRMNRFTLRRKAKVNIQWCLYCMVHNIGKIAGAMAVG